MSTFPEDAALRPNPTVILAQHSSIYFHLPSMSICSDFARRSRELGAPYFELFLIMRWLFIFK